MTFIIYKYKRFVSLYLVRFTSSILQFVIDSGERNVNESQLIICLLLYKKKKNVYQKLDTIFRKLKRECKL